MMKCDSDIQIDVTLADTKAKFGQKSTPQCCEVMSLDEWFTTFRGACIFIFNSEDVYDCLTLKINLLGPSKHQKSLNERHCHIPQDTD